MTLPREVIPGRCYMITRRCTQRQFLLRPDEETNNAFLYCLAEAAQRCNIAVLLTCAMSNHHHTVIFDRDGTVPAFTEHFHKLLAKCQNAWRGRWENLWASEQACAVHLVNPLDVLHKLVYVATNPFKDGSSRKCITGPVSTDCNEVAPPASGPRRWMQVRVRHSRCRQW